MKVTNEGIGTAFNLRYGVIVDGVETASGGGRGTRHRLRPGAEISVMRVDAQAEVDDDELDERVQFFARYEDAFGQDWETINPADVRKDFEIRRVKRREFRIGSRRFVFR